MPAPIYLGEEVGAAGYRLAGARVHTPGPREATAALADACLHAPLVLVSAGVAAQIAPAALQRALVAPAPLVLVVPDVLEDTPMPDLAARLRAQLGSEG